MQAWSRWLLAPLWMAQTLLALPVLGQEANTGLLPAATAANAATFGPELGAGVVATLSSSSAHDEIQRFDTGYTLGVWYRPRMEYALGARYMLLGLGSGESTNGANGVDVSYDAHVVWGQGRVYPYQYLGHALFVGVRAGAVVMHQSAHGTWPAGFDQPVGAPFHCSATTSPNLALGGELGYERGIGEHLRFASSVNLDALRGTSSVVGDCTTGLGSPIVMHVGIGFSYLFEL